MKHARSLRRFVLIVVAGIVAGTLALSPAHASDSSSGKGSSSGSGSSVSSGSGSSGSGRSGKGPEDSVPDAGGVSTPASTPASVPATVPTTVPPTSATRPPSTPVGTSPRGGSGSFSIERMVACGSMKVSLSVRSDGATVRVKSRLKPEPKGTWDATLVRDRSVVWRGKVDRGRVERSMVDLPGAEMLLLRLSNGAGTVCSAGATLPG